MGTFSQSCQRKAREDSKKSVSCTCLFCKFSFHYTKHGDMSYRGNSLRSPPIFWFVQLQSRKSVRTGLREERKKKKKSISTRRKECSKKIPTCQSSHKQIEPLSYLARRSTNTQPCKKRDTQNIWLNANGFLLAFGVRLFSSVSNRASVEAAPRTHTGWTGMRFSLFHYFHQWPERI